MRLTDQGEPLVAAGGGLALSTQVEKKQDYVGATKEGFRGRKHLAGPAGVLSSTQCPKKPGDLDY